MRPLRAVTDLLFPPRCLGCGGMGSFFCPACVKATPQLEGPLCPACAMTVDPTYPVCRCRRHALRYVRAAGTYDNPLRLAIQRFKYGGRRAAEVDLAAVLDRAVSPFAAIGPVLVPVALHPSRERQRGYNQATLLARAVSTRHGMTVLESSLRRVKPTQPQVGLSAEARTRNIKGAFAADSAFVRGKDVLLVDDVCTTGATLRAAAEALQQAGAHKVYAAVLAFAALDHGG